MMEHDGTIFNIFKHGYHGQFASSLLCLTIAEGEEKEGERRPVDLLASPQVKKRTMIKVEAWLGFEFFSSNVGSIILFKIFSIFIRESLDTNLVFFSLICNWNIKFRK